MNLLPRWFRRRRRFADHTDYVCTGCGWWFHHITRDRWLGPYWAERDGSTGGGGRPLTWAELVDTESDCVPRLVRRSQA